MSLQAIILTQRGELRTACREELKRLGLKPDDLINCKDPSEVLEHSGKAQSAFLILDWDIGGDLVLEALQGNIAKGKVDSNPSFILASQEDKNLLAVAREFSVSQIHLGAVSTENIRGCLKKLMQETKESSPIKSVISKVAKAKAEGEFNLAVQVLKPLYEKMPDNARIAIDLADCYLELGQLDEAKPILDQACASEPKNARAFHVASRYYLKSNDPEAAAKCLEQAKLINPYNVDRLIELGNIFMDIDRPKDAKDSFNSVLDFAPDNKSAKVKKGESMLALGEVNEALALIKEATSIKELASVFNNSAILQIRKGEHEKAIELYRSAMGVVGKNRKVEARLWYNMGIGYVKWQKFDDSLDCFQKSTTADSNFQDAAHNLEKVKAVLASKQGKKSKKKAASPPKAPEAAAPPMALPTIEAEDMSADLGGLEETIGGEDFTKEFSDFSFDTDFDDD